MKGTLLHDFFSTPKTVGVVTKGVLVAAAGNSHKPTIRTNEVSRSADFPSKWHGDQHGYSPAW